MTSRTPQTKASRPSSPRKAPTTRPAEMSARPTDELRTAAVPEGSVVLAAIVGAHGLGGEVRLKLFTDELTRYPRLNGGALTLRSLRNGIARFGEIADRTAAETLRGTTLWIDRAELPPLGEGEYYHVDLIGLAAVSTSGEALGCVIAVDNFGAGDVVEIERSSGRRFMVPMRAEAVPDWDRERLIVAAEFIGT